MQALIYKCIVGSQAYGTNIETSDEDLKGVYLQSPREILTGKYKQQKDNSKDDVDYEVLRFLELLQSANPTVLELLYSPEDCVIHKHPIFDLIIENRDNFLTKECRNSFAGYAIQQIKKAKGLNKKMNWEDRETERKTPLDFCYMTYNGGSKPFTEIMRANSIKQEFCGLVNVPNMRDTYAVYYDYAGDFQLKTPIGFRGIQIDEGNTVRVSSVPEGMTPTFYIQYNKDGYTQHCKAYHEYQTWLKERNTQRYIDIQGHNQKIDGKNLMHCVRLLDTAKEIATEGLINVRRPNREFLLSIRRGEVDLDTLIDLCDERISELDELFLNSSLPNKADKNVVDEIITEIRTQQILGFK